MHSTRWLPAQFYLQDAAHDVRCNFGMWGIFIFPRGLQVVLQTRLPESHQGFPVLFDGRGFPDGRGDPGDADLHHSLVVVVSLVILGHRKGHLPMNWFARTPHNSVFIAVQCPFSHVHLYNKCSAWLNSGICHPTELNSHYCEGMDPWNLISSLICFR